MATIPVRRLTTAAAAALTLAATGCSSVGDAIAERAAEEVLEQAGGDDLEIDLDDDGEGISIQSSEGSLDIGGGTLPNSFPDDMPLPEPHEVIGAFEQTDGDTAFMSVNIETSGDVDGVAADLEGALESSPWTIDDTIEFSSSGDTSVTFQVSDGDRTGGISVLMGEGDAVAVMYTLDIPAG